MSCFFFFSLFKTGCWQCLFGVLTWSVSGIPARRDCLLKKLHDEVRRVTVCERLWVKLLHYLAQLTFCLSFPQEIQELQAQIQEQHVQILIWMFQSLTSRLPCVMSVSSMRAWQALGGWGMVQVQGTDKLVWPEQMETILFAVLVCGS